MTADDLEAVSPAQATALRVMDAEEALNAKRLHHNAYMRFFRSVRSPKTEDHIRKSFQQANSRGRYAVTLLFEDYLQSGENWAVSSLTFNFTRKLTAEKRGRVRWCPPKVTWADLN